MHDFLLHVAVAAVSFLIGALLTRVWDRARPFLVLQGFGEFGEQKVDCPQDLVQLSVESWVTPVLEDGSNPLDVVRNVYESASYCVTVYEKSLAKLPGLILRLQAEQKNDVVLSTLRDAITDQGLREALDSCLRMREIELEAISKFEGPELLQIVETSSAYRITWQKDFSVFSSRLDEFPELKFRLAPFITAMRYLHQPTILSALQRIGSALERQINIHRKIQSLAQRIIDEHGGWSAHLLVMNYGATAMIIWQDAKLVVTHRKTPYRLSCRPQILEDQRWRFLEGPHVLSPGQELQLRLCTETKSRIEDGRILRTYYTATEDKDKAQGRVWLKVTRRGAFGSMVRSNRVDFDSGVRDRE